MKSELIALLSLSPSGYDLYNKVVPNNLQVPDAVPLLIANFWHTALLLAGLVTLLYLLQGGFSWLTSGGDKQAAENAKNKITSALIGLSLVVTSYAIIKFVGNTLLIPNFLKFVLPTP